MQVGTGNGDIQAHGKAVPARPHVARFSAINRLIWTSVCRSLDRRVAQDVKILLHFARRARYGLDAGVARLAQPAIELRGVTAPEDAPEPRRGRSMTARSAH